MTNDQRSSVYPERSEGSAEQPRLTQPAPEIPRSARNKLSGFTLIELIVVVTIIGILAAAAMVNMRFAVRKAREAALKDNLHEMRKAIDNFYADKQRYPSDLNELVPNYIRMIPADPITNNTDWDTTVEDPMNPTLNPDSTDTGEQPPAETDPQAMTQPGVTDVHSKAPGVTLDNVPYSQL
jgi:general secretion pathway protein G